MQVIVLKIFQIWFKLVETVLPVIARKWSVNLFFSPMRFKRPFREEAFVKKAQISKIPFQINLTELYNLEWAKGKVLNKQFNQNTDKTFYTLYELGEGPVVLLVHGWSGRASQMGSIATALADKGFKTITFDAFAHGSSPGKQTTVLEFVKIIKNIHEKFGPFEAIVGHSLGGIAAGKAITEGVECKNLITIGSPTTMNFILEAFGKIINASSTTQNYIKTFVEKYARANASEFSLTNIGQKLSVPGLLIHDKNDTEAEYDQALLFEEMWPQGRLVTTEGLGHSRILRDKKVLEIITSFVSLPVYSEEPIL
ncbi:MAG: alpha/beta fold hydrolase [Calditrichaeota bacterium]|nr:MAG: alpha/beta fold hydrolase [Calditrichota bacterium]MBL1207891.1 alpha/beta fold hydrolase [Calditrichota bacterium]NOG47726.1 alpha/beta fold hydrolase [Calditrichota bacterium]